jgi:multicomponent Na+:H+ antiporter subunit G
MRLAADIFLLIGAGFALLGALGLIRMPDVYNRIQTATKGATMGSLALLIGIGLIHPEWWAKLVCIGGFVLFTNPVSSSTLARAFYVSGVKPWREGADDASATDEGRG